MQIDKITAELRPRTPYEAIDLGMAMARSAGRRLWLAWFVTTMPVFLLCNLVGYWLDMMWLGALMVWWLKPLFDRVPLFVLSRHLFGDTPSVGATLRALPRLWFFGLPSALVLERLDLARSLDLPVAQLEGMKWFARSKRTRLLQRGTRGPGVTLTLACLGIEAAFYSGVWTLALMFVPFEYLPESFRVLWADFFTHATPAYQLLNNTVWYLAISVVEPLYVGAGFALYLNRRTQLEAWDIEIALKRMAERLQAGAKAAAVLAALALCLSCLLHPVAAFADDPQPDAPPPAATRVLPLPHPDSISDADEAHFVKSAAQALQDPDLSPHEKSGHLEYVADPAKPEAKTVAAPGWLATLLGWFGRSSSAAISFLPWLIGLILLGLAVRYRRWFLAWFEGMDRPPPAAAFDPHLHVLQQQEPLPADLVGATRALWEQGETRRALSLLYRGSVARMQELSGRELPEGATEADCLRESAKLPAGAAETLRRVVRAWQYAAYAHRVPESQAFGELLDAWRAELGARP